MSEDQSVSVEESSTEETNPIDKYEVNENPVDHTMEVGNKETGIVKGIPAVSEDEIPADWSWSSDNPGKGERPDWLLEKYKNVEDQAKAYIEAQKTIGELGQKAGTVHGAPDEYQLPAVEGWEWDTEDQTLKSAMNQFKQDGIDQDHVNQYLTLYANAQKGVALDAAEEKKSIGPDADEQIATLKNWARNNFSEDSAEIVEGVLNAPTLAGVRLLQEIKGKMSQSVPPPNEYQPKGQSLEEIQQEMMDNLYKGKNIAKNSTLQKAYEKKIADAMGRKKD